MIKVENVIVAGVNQAMYGCRLSHGSTERMDSSFYRFGDNDLTLAKRLYNAGTDHSAFLRQIQVWFRLTAPVFFWKHWDKYKWVNRFENEIEERSESVMHGIMKEELTQVNFNKPVPKVVLDVLNSYRERGQFEELVNCLPQGFLQERQINTNLAVVLEMVKQRKRHRLVEWSEFVRQVRSFVYIDNFLDI